MVDWSKESWIKVFPRESGAWQTLSWQARGLYRLLQGEATREGIINPGRRGTEWAAVVFRMSNEDAHTLVHELICDGFIAVLENGSWLLQSHAEQQGTVTSSTERVRRFRERQKAEQAPNVTATVSGVTDESYTERKEIKKEINKDEKERARASEAAARVPDDPKAKHLAIVLAANKKFAGLDHADVAEGLVGGLGPLALKLTDKHAEDAVAAAAAEAETGANERRLRQVLGWKLKDQVQPQRKANSKTVQGEGEDNDAWLADLMSRTVQL